MTCRSAIIRRFTLGSSLRLLTILGLTFSVTAPVSPKLFATGPKVDVMGAGMGTSSPGDSTTLVAPVPEPGVIACLIGGVAILLSLRRRHG